MLVLTLEGLYDDFFIDNIFYDSVLGWMSNDWLDGTVLHRWEMHLYRLVQKGFKGNNKCGILNPSRIDFRLCRTEGDKVVKHVVSNLRVQQDKTIFAAPYLQWACHDTLADWNWNMVKCPQQEETWECGYYVAIAMFELFFKLQSNFPHNVKGDKVVKHAESNLRVQQDKTIFTAPYLQWACHDTLGDWNWNMVKIWNDIKPKSMRYIDECVENSVSQFCSIHLPQD
nr:hypothetical protein [Tanacetum cinerariifolium]